MHQAPHTHTPALDQLLRHSPSARSLLTRARAAGAHTRERALKKAYSAELEQSSNWVVVSKPRDNQSMPQSLVIILLQRHIRLLCLNFGGSNGSFRFAKPRRLNKLFCFPSFARHGVPGTSSPYTVRAPCGSRPNACSDGSRAWSSYPLTDPLTDPSRYTLCERFALQDTLS